MCHSAQHFPGQPGSRIRLLRAVYANKVHDQERNSDDQQRVNECTCRLKGNSKHPQDERQHRESPEKPVRSIAKVQMVHAVSAYRPATGISGQYGSQPENSDSVDRI